MRLVSRSTVSPGPTWVYADGLYDYKMRVRRTNNLILLLAIIANGPHTSCFLPDRAASTTRVPSGREGGVWNASRAETVWSAPSRLIDQSLRIKEGFAMSRRTVTGLISDCDFSHVRPDDLLSPATVPDARIARDEPENVRY